MRTAILAPSGSLSVTKYRTHRAAPLAWRAKNFVLYRLPDWPRLAIAYLAVWCGVPVMLSHLYLKLVKANGETIDYGLVGTRVVTTTGVNFIVDAFQNSVEVENLKYHGVGTGTTAEAVGDTALVAESTTILTVDSTRATGSTTEGATANIYRTVGTISFDGAGAITEHGIFNQAATGGGTLLDRTVFAAVNVVSGDSIQATYELTLTAGS